ncbi:MAG: hypothetical protein AVDCRST_MAG77-1998 [uncultured Chloroflexi bacterium]|uniref:Rhamnogalacturonase A/B/Epimerase-like pectate lyase domain-containing protein n=1 Tax=uncultured Chloroflexota bacterium TaxID=166587 RepID=A0A6J4H0U5_9CHLR|nr:MAG: hypothetical protein AVDCRST_MAG77-1998 [uncultured Chloroflexota bacterium]
MQTSFVRQEPTPEWFPALALTIASPPRGSVPEVDFKAEFGAAGDGATDDAPAFARLSEAVNTGKVAPGSVIFLPQGGYRVPGNTTVSVRRPVVLRGAGPGQTVLRLEYTQQRSTFLRVQGDGVYQAHSTSLYDGRQEANRYPNGPFAAVEIGQGSPKRGDVAVTVDRPELFKAGDNVYLLCDDYGDETTYTAKNKRFRHYLLKQYLAVTRVDGNSVAFDTPLRHDFAGAAPRLYRWQPVPRFGIEHLSIEDRSTIADTEASNTFKAISFDGVVDGWVWDVHFLDNTSIPLSVGKSRRVVVSECVFDRARHVGGGGNGYLPELYYSDDCLVEYSTSVQGRHALITNWSCWGNVFRFNRVSGTPNTETHGEYNVENLYLRNDARGSRMEVGGGGTTVHAHDGPFNELRENYARAIRILKPADRANRLIGNWHVDAPTLNGAETFQENNQRVPAAWPDYPYAAYCGHDHTQTAETARPV